MVSCHLSCSKAFLGPLVASWALHYTCPSQISAKYHAVFLYASNISQTTLTEMVFAYSSYTSYSRGLRRWMNRSIRVPPITYFGVKWRILPLCLKGKFYANHAFVHKGKILRQGCHCVHNDSILRHWIWCKIPLWRVMATFTKATHT